MAKFKSELTWSFSRDRLFGDCRRAYYYHYYASWGGWEKDADEFTRQAYILKNIRNIDAWVGDIVHQVIKWVLESKILPTNSLFSQDKDINLPRATHKAKQMLMKTWEQSRSKTWVSNIKGSLNLFEHYYKRKPSRDELAPKLEKVIKSLKNFYASGLLETISELSQENIVGIEELDSFDFEGIKAFAIPDFAIRKDKYLLFDWKTGKRSDKDVLQLSCYLLYAIKKWEVEPEKIQIIPAYLTAETCFLPVKPLGVDQVNNYIRNSIAAMKTVLVDIVQNKADIKLCQKTKDTWRCKNCKFQEICT